ncbi:glycosyltransferase family 4 protein [Marinilabilia rubra]|uniref:Glycosyl transferase family 1 n=1 Tax=Marinilabilia rubra TaxID=2162893 RepID=A0A2U2B9N9_9BACT|nr:glycosyltransferase family 4 protein [Marinilabilia rubra]PWD99762.1 glycosyl transferase family 1 [Marinilabilia rubra]
MKILHINQSDETGGAAVAAVRLLEALRNHGAEAEMLVLEGGSDDSAIHSMVKNKWSRILRKVKFAAEVFSFVPFEKNSRQRFAFSSGRFGYDISENPLVKQADVLHLHWINQGFLSLNDLNKLIHTGKPIVWTLHDTWAFTGGCHYPGTCGGFTSTCGNCPLLKSPGSNDLSALQHLRKEKMYANASITFVGCSNWMKQMADRSSLVRKDLKHSVRHVFNTIDTELFKPADKGKVRAELGLPVDKKLLLFGAANTTDPRKGTIHLLRALKHLNARDPNLKNELELMAFGKNIDAFAHELPFVMHPFHTVKSQERMVHLYQAADLFVLPSMQDNLPNTVVESMSAGVPVVGFDIGGVPEMIMHQENGFLTAPGEWKDLAEGIIYVLGNGTVLGENARKFAESHFAPDAVARKYVDIYQSVAGG